MEALEIFTNLGVALLLGALIGLERQWRQKPAGLRTNALVALGSAGFVSLSLLVHDVSPTRVASQVVSGIGFLGAGAIIREGIGVRGLNTAATIWATASVGVLAGSGYLLSAGLLTGLILISNILFRPIARFVDRHRRREEDTESYYLVSLVGTTEAEAHLRTLLVQLIAPSQLLLKSLSSEHTEDGKRVRIQAEIISTGQAHSTLEEVVARLSLEPSITSIGWQLKEEYIQE